MSVPMHKLVFALGAIGLAAGGCSKAQKHAPVDTTLSDSAQPTAPATSSYDNAIETEAKQAAADAAAAGENGSVSGDNPNQGVGASSDNQSGPQPE